MSALNEIAVGYEPEMNISSIDLTRFLYRLNWTNMPEKRLNGLLWLIGTVEIMKMLQILG